MSAAPTHRSPAEQARIEAEVIEMIEQRTPWQKAMGVKVERLLPDLVLRLDWRPEFAGHPLLPRMHGAVVAGVLDILGGACFMMAIAQKHPTEDFDQVMQRALRVATIDLRVDFLRAATGATFRASSEVTRLGGRVGSAQMRLHDDEHRLVATACGSYVVS